MRNYRDESSLLFLPIGDFSRELRIWGISLVHVVMHHVSHTNSWEKGRVSRLLISDVEAIAQCLQHLMDLFVIPGKDKCQDSFTDTSLAIMIIIIVVVVVIVTM